jgi:hypothetical protein
MPTECSADSFDLGTARVLLHWVAMQDKAKRSTTSLKHDQIQSAPCHETNIPLRNPPMGRHSIGNRPMSPAPTAGYNRHPNASHPALGENGKQDRCRRDLLVDRALLACLHPVASLKLPQQPSPAPMLGRSFAVQDQYNATQMLRCHEPVRSQLLDHPLVSFSIVAGGPIDRRVIWIGLSRAYPSIEIIEESIH